MSEILSDFRTRVQSLSRVPTSVVTDSQTDQCIGKALSDYSRKIPLKTTTGFTLSTSSNTYILTSIVANWDERYTVVEVSYQPSNRFRKPIDGASWQVVETDGVYSLIFVPEWFDELETFSAGSGTYYLTYSYPHTLNATLAECTVRAEDLEALAYLASSYCCTEAAAEASDQKDSSFTSDVVDYQSIADRWHKQAAKHFKIWQEHVKGRNGGNDSWGQWDMQARSGSFLFHGGRRF